jgi:hypothetical protein
MEYMSIITLKLNDELTFDEFFLAYCAPFDIFFLEDELEFLVPLRKCLHEEFARIFELPLKGRITLLYILGLIITASCLSKMQIIEVELLIELSRIHAGVNLFLWLLFHILVFKRYLHL